MASSSSIPPKRSKPTAATSGGPINSRGIRVPGTTRTSTSVAEETVDFSQLDWIPLSKPAFSPGKQGITLSLPFGDVEENDIPDVLRSFGGAECVAKSLRQPREVNRSLTFTLSQNPDCPPLLSHPMPLKRTHTSNSFILQLECEESPETADQKAARTMKELTAVERALGKTLPLLPPKIRGASLTNIVDITYVFDKLYDYEMCPALVRTEETDGEEKTMLDSIVHQILPSVPMSKTSDPEQSMLFFPSLKFSNQSAFSQPEYIPSLYLDTLAAHEKIVQRMRQSFPIKIAWTGGPPPEIPSQPHPGALKNLNSVPKEIVNAAKKLLEEQPIWRREVFYHELKQRTPSLLKEHKRFLTPALAYRWTKGPWSRMWVKFGYDPLQHPECRRYQTIDYRINLSIWQTKKTRKKSNYKSETVHLLRKMAKQSGSGSSANNVDASKGLQFIAQLSELVVLGGIRRIVEDPKRVRPECDGKEGHFVDGTMESVRLVITKAIESEDQDMLKLPKLVKAAQSLGFFKNIKVPDADAEESDSDAEV